MNIWWPVACSILTLFRYALLIINKMCYHIWLKSVAGFIPFCWFSITQYIWINKLIRKNSKVDSNFVRYRFIFLSYPRLNKTNACQYIQYNNSNKYIDLLVKNDQWKINIWQSLYCFFFFFTRSDSLFITVEKKGTKILFLRRFKMWKSGIFYLIGNFRESS